MRRIFCVAVLTILWCSGALAEETMDSTPIDEANARLAALQKEGNAAGMGRMYTEDAVLLPPGGGNIRGRNAIASYWAQQLGAGVEDVKLTTEQLVPLGNDLAYEIGRYTTTPRGAEPMSGHYLVIWKQSDGEWKLHVDIFNTGEQAE